MNNQRLDAEGAIFATADPNSECSLAANFAKLELAMFENAADLLRSFKADDEEGFSAAVSFASQHCLSAERIADICQVSTGTVSRWAAGAAKPIKIARMYAVEQIMVYLNDVIAQSKSNVDDALKVEQRVARVIQIPEKKVRKRA